MRIHRIYKGDRPVDESGYRHGGDIDYRCWRLWFEAPPIPVDAWCYMHPDEGEGRYQWANSLCDALDEIDSAIDEMGDEQHARQVALEEMVESDELERRRG